MILDFLDAKKQLSKKKKANESSGKISVCRPTIITSRIAQDTVLISFVDLFNPKTLAAAISDLVYTETDWVAYKHKYDEKGYYSYYIRLKYPQEEEDARNRLNKLTGTLIRHALAKTCKQSAGRLTIVDMSKPNVHVEEIDKETFSALKKSGLYNVSELIKKEREDICLIKGMTTLGLFTLECNLASRGLFLKKPEVGSFY